MKTLEALVCVVLGLGLYATYVVWAIRIRRDCTCIYCAEES